MSPSAGIVATKGTKGTKQLAESFCAFVAENLLVAQCDDRIDFRGAASGHVAREDSDRDEQ